MAEKKKWYCVKKGLLRLPENAKYAISYNLELNLFFKKCFKVNDLNSYPIHKGRGSERRFFSIEGFMFLLAYLKN